MSVTASAPYGTLAEDQFRRLASVIHSRFGIKMPPEKRPLLESRLQKRLCALELEGFDEYIEYLFSRDHFDTELLSLQDIVTTNKTEFFREADHLDYLRNVVAPAVYERFGAGAGAPMRVWSAGCATGEEPYSIAMVLEELSARWAPLDYSILATDLSGEALDHARHAVYAQERIEPIPQRLRKRFLMRSKNPSRKQVRIVPQLRQKVKFAQLNFKQTTRYLAEQMDIVFCRNVIIYFDDRTKQEIVGRICENLRSGGYLFMGHSETLYGMKVPLRQAAPTIYQKE